MGAFPPELNSICRLEPAVGGKPRRSGGPRGGGGESGGSKRRSSKAGARKSKGIGVAAVAAAGGLAATRCSPLSLTATTAGRPRRSPSFET